MKKLCQIVEITLTRNAIRAVDVDSALKKHYKYPDISKDEYTAIRRHQMTSLRVNHYLWETHKRNTQPSNPVAKDQDMDEYNIDEAKERIGYLDNAMKHHKTPSKLTVYSGSIHDPREHMNSDKVVHHPAYLSTSVDQKVAHDRAYIKSEGGTIHVFKIHVPKGHPSIYCPGVNTPSSLTTEEKELILPRGSNLKYMKTVKPNFPMSKENHDRTFVHHMRVVP